MLGDSLLVYGLEKVCRSYKPITIYITNLYYSIIFADFKTRLRSFGETENMRIAVPREKIHGGARLQEKLKPKSTRMTQTLHMQSLDINRKEINWILNVNRGIL